MREGRFVARRNLAEASFPMQTDPIGSVDSQDDRSREEEGRCFDNPLTRCAPSVVCDT